MTMNQYIPAKLIDMSGARKPKFRVGQVVMLKGSACPIKLLHPFKDTYHDEYGNEYQRHELRPLTAKERGPSTGRRKK